MIGVFDRSHYEDVLIARVRALAADQGDRARYGAINDFEKRLVDDGHHGRQVHAAHLAEEQKARLLARLDDPTKLWKFNPGDIDERQHCGRRTTRPTRSPSSAPTPSTRPGSSCPATASGTASSPSAQVLLETLQADGPDLAARRTSTSTSRRGAGSSRRTRDVIRTVSATRYVAPLREGGSLPGIVEADDLGTYVCKFRGAGQGLKVLVAEVVVGELARRARPRGPPSSSASTWRRRSGSTRPTRRCRTCSPRASG